MDLYLVRKNIRDVRHEKKMTQAELAKRTGLCAGFIGDLERGTRGLTLPTLVKIANALEVPASRLIPTEKEIVTAKILDRIKDFTPAQYDAFMKFVDSLISE